MSYIVQPTNLDAFYRQRFSQPTIKFQSKQIADARPLSWSNAFSKTSGSDPTFSHSTARASSLITLPSGTIAQAWRQTRRRFNYQPGQSSLVVFTGVAGTGLSNLTRRIGLFDEDNGVFFEQSGADANTGISVVIRSKVTGSVVDTNRKAREDWDDPLDGTGKSGVTLDLAKVQIYFIDFEWLGAGAVRFGFFYQGRPWYVHEFNHANIIDSVFMSTPNNPIRYEIESTADLGEAATLEHICATYISEGGSEDDGDTFAVDLGVTEKSTQNDANLYPLCGIRLAAGYEGGEVSVESLHVYPTTNVEYRWALLLNPTFTAFTPTYAQYKSTCVATATSSADTEIVNDPGHVLASGYDSSASAFNITRPNDFRLGVAADGLTRDSIWLCVQKIGTGGTEDFFGSIQWRERI